MNIADLFRKKSIEKIQSDAASGFSDAESVGGDPHLRRTLGLTDLTLMGIAAIIGASIFAMIGGASYKGGPAIIFLFIFTAIACAFSALCYAEFASRIPVAGSAYTYAYASFGELAAWIIGWDLIVEYSIGNIAVAISWSGYFTGLLSGYGINIPLNYTMDFRTAWIGLDAVNAAIKDGAATVESLKAVCGATGAAVSCLQIEGYTAWTSAPQIAGYPIILDLPALLITVLITVLVYIGIRESKFASNAMTILKIGIILLVIFAGAFYVNPANWSPFAPNGIRGVMAGVAAVFFAYIGFDALSTTAEECNNPRRDLPRAMLLSLILCTVLYIILALVLTGMVSYSQLNVDDPLAFVFGPAGANISWLAGLISFSAVIALATVFLVFQIGQPRLWMAMSRDGLLPKIFSAIHPRFKTPWFSTIITGLVVAIPALFMNLTEVTDLGVIGTLFAFALVCGGILIKDKDFGRENRYVPYINSQFIAPLLFAVILFFIIFFNGVSGIYDKAENLKAGTMTEQISDVERQQALEFSPYNINNLAKIAVYQEGLRAVGDFFVVKPDVEKQETWFGAFSHKIPFIVFAIFSVAMTGLCIIKRLTLIPVLGVMSCAYLMTELGVINWMRFGIWLAIGLVVYFCYGAWNSKLRTADSQQSSINN